MTDPYQTLGVDRDADPKEIRKAYLRKSKKAHPDAGGTNAEMSELTRAMAILGDPVKKARFDSGEPEMDSEEQMILTRFTMFCRDIIEGKMGIGEVHIAQTMKNYKDQVNTKYQGEKAKIESDRKKLDAFEARVLKAPENNIIAGIIANSREVIKAAEKKLELDTRVELAAIEKFSEYEFKEPQMDPFSMSGFPFGTWRPV